MILYSVGTIAFMIFIFVGTKKADEINKRESDPYFNRRNHTNGKFKKLPCKCPTIKENLKGIYIQTCKKCGKIHY